MSVIINGKYVETDIYSEYVAVSHSLSSFLLLFFLFDLGQIINSAYYVAEERTLYFSAQTNTNSFLQSFNFSSNTLSVASASTPSPLFDMLIV